MSALDVRGVLERALKGSFDDEGILEYLCGVVEGMSLEEKRNSSVLFEVISPFLIDAGAVADASAAEVVCKSLSVAFGGSGYKKAASAVESEDDTPQLLATAVKIKDLAGLEPAKKTYGGAVFADAETGEVVDSNTAYEGSAIPTTQKQLRKQRKENEALNKILRVEAQQRAEAAAEMMAARMAAIRASRASGRQANTGVNIERLSLPHPSGTGDLLTDVTFSLAPGRKYGLVGRNGAGKSTLMKHLANYKDPSLLHLKILLVDQHVEGDEATPLQWVLRADVERTALLEDEARLTIYMHAGVAEDGEGGTPSKPAPPLPPDLVGVNIELALTECYERMDAIGVSTAETRAMKILAGLGFDEGMEPAVRPTAALSGGWAMRAALAAALFVKPNLLLLDEPTNHLDLHALVWLENYLLSEFAGIAVIVSHDEVFLNAVCTDVLELRSTLAGQQKSTLEHFSGDYDTFQNTLKERRVAQARAREAYEKEKEKLREFISREGKKYDNPAHQAQRKMKQKQLQALTEVEEVEEDSELVLSIPRPYGVFEQSEKLLAVQNVSFAWPGSAPLFAAVDFVVSPRARIAILGKNGCGKTSLLNILLGEEAPSSGSVTKHLGCRVTMLQQHHYRGEQLDPSLCALDHVKRLPQDESTAVGLHDPGTRQEESAQRGFLANFGIRGSRALIPVKYLSGGQRMRVALAMALFRRPDVLILDEVNWWANEVAGWLAGAVRRGGGL